MHMGCFLYVAHGQLERAGFINVPKDTTVGQIIADMRVCTRSPLVEGWSLHSLHHSVSLNAINTERFKKDFVVGLCICACGSHVHAFRNPAAAMFSHLSVPSCVFHVFQPHFCKYLYRV